ncbi:MAG: response regulator, partial [Desulfosudaceae bacterium]
MKKILSVSVDTLIINKISSLLRKHEQASDFDVLTAESLQEAAAILKKTKIDIVIIDLFAPSQSDFEYLKTITKNNARLPFMVMSGLETGKIKSAIKFNGAMQYFAKPIDFTALTDKIVHEMAGGVGGVFHGISLASFLQMSEMEGTTCTLKVTAGENEEGRIYLQKGLPVAATTEAASGEEAVYEILDWDRPTIEIEYPELNITREIDKPLQSLLEELTRRQDKKAGKSVHESGKVVFKPVPAEDTADIREDTEKEKAVTEKKKITADKKPAGTQKQKAAAGKKKAAPEKKKAAPEKEAAAAPRKTPKRPPAEQAAKARAESNKAPAADEPRAAEDIIPWWKNKKIRYGIMAGIAGFVCLGLFAFFFSGFG